MEERIKRLHAEAEAALAAAQDGETLEQVRIRYLGKKGELTQLLRGLGQLPPDERPRRVARARGIELARTARQIRRDELDRWDYIVVMDESNRRDVLSLGADPARVVKLRDFDPEGPGDVPDPYYGGLDAFEQVYGIIDRSLDGFLEALRPSLDPGTGL